jgi:hypothetical protein
MRPSARMRCSRTDRRVARRWRRAVERGTQECLVETVGHGLVDVQFRAAVETRGGAGQAPDGQIVVRSLPAVPDPVVGQPRGDARADDGHGDVDPVAQHDTAVVDAERCRVEGVRVDVLDGVLAGVRVVDGVEDLRDVLW